MLSAPTEIQRQLELPGETCSRYVSQAFEHYGELMSQRITNEEILNQDDIVIKRVDV
jgi:hypothetical protein